MGVEAVKKLPRPLFQPPSLHAPWHAPLQTCRSQPAIAPLVLSEQIQPGTFKFALDHLVDEELDRSALDARFRNDQTGARAYDPRVMLMNSPGIRGG